MFQKQKTRLVLKSLLRGLYICSQLNPVLDRKIEESVTQKVFSQGTVNILLKDPPFLFIEWHV